MSGPYCYNCGEAEEYVHVYPVDADLISSWKLTPGLARQFNEREGLICAHCGVNKRAQGLAYAILKSPYGYRQDNLKDWVKEANKHQLAVCELNSCHELHKTLVGLKNLTYAEYGTKTQQDIENLSYKEDRFDLVLHSETVEHVDNPAKAIDECRRVIKQDGLVLFTTPVVWGRKTMKRASIREGKTIKHSAPSYHGYKTDDYLVFSEFGGDIDKLLGVKVVMIDSKFQNFVFGTGKATSKMSPTLKLKLRLLERKFSK